MKIQAIGPRPIGVDFFVEDTGATPGTRPTRTQPQELSAVGALAGLAPRRRQAQGPSMAPRKPLDDIQTSFQARRKEPDKEAEPVSSGRASAVASGPRAPARSQRRRLTAHHHEPDHHDTPPPQLNSGSAEALFAARQVQVGLAARVSGLGTAQQAPPQALPVDQAGDSDQARFERPRDRRGHGLAALQRLLGAPLQDPTQAHPERYDAAAKAALKQRIVEQGPSFRTTPAEHQEFREAFLFQAQAELPVRLKAAGSTLAHQAYDSLMGQVAQLQRTHPELRHIPAEDLAALRAFTGSHRDMVQNALLGEQVPANPLALSFAKAVVSALHALPPAYTHQGPAYTRLDAAAGTPQPPSKPGETRIEWQVFGASQARESGHAAVQTQALNAKNIAVFALRPQEQELVFPPGTGFRVDRTTAGPDLTVMQSELPHRPPDPSPNRSGDLPPPDLMASRRAAAPAA